MDLRQLRYFVVLADELHFRRAAERLNITQAPLSVAMQNLERELGGQLFHRSQRRVALTGIGTAFRDHALAVLGRLDSSLADIREMVSGHSGQLRIGFTGASTLLPFFARMICEFRTRYPKVGVTLRDMSSTGQLVALEHRDIDIGIIRSHGAHPRSDLSFTKLLRDPLVVAMRDDSPLAQGARLTIGDLRDQPLIFYPARSGIGLYEHVVGLCARHGFAPRVVQEAQEPATIIGLAASGLGVAVVPSELQCISVANLVFRELADEEAMTDVILASRAGDGNQIVARFTHIAQAAAAPALKADVHARKMAAATKRFTLPGAS